jgi:phenylacetate-CoA ligase
MGKLQSLYDRMPLSVQTISLSVYGLLLHWQRYGYRAGNYAEELREHETWSSDRLRELELELLRRRALLAIERVPAYAGLVRHLPAVREARSVEEVLDLFPVLTKQHVRLNPEAFVPTGLRQSLLYGATSGTTGTPLKLFRTRDGVRRNFAYFRRVRRWRGLSHWNRTATLLGRTPVPKDQHTPPFWRYAWFTKNLLLSSYHVGPTSVEGYADALAAFRPEQVVCIPSCVMPVAEFMARSGRTLDSVRTVFTTAETLSAEQRTVLQTAFGAPVADQYGASEWTVWISQCENGTYHVHPEYGFLEVLDHNAKRVTEGRGRAVTTGFINDAMVLVRYDTGDFVTASSTTSCSCGRAFRIITSIDGRLEDSIVSPRGRVVPGTLVSLFRGLSGIIEGQVVQTSASTLLVRIVADKTWSPLIERQIVEGIDNRVGGGLDITVQLVDAIPRTPAGKFRSVIGLNSRAGADASVGDP